MSLSARVRGLAHGALYAAHVRLRSCEFNQREATFLLLGSSSFRFFASLAVDDMQTCTACLSAQWVAHGAVSVALPSNSPLLLLLPHLLLWLLLLLLRARTHARTRPQLDPVPVQRSIWLSTLRYATLPNMQMQCTLPTAAAAASPPLPLPSSPPAAWTPPPPPPPLPRPAPVPAARPRGGRRPERGRRRQRPPPRWRLRR